MTERTIEQIVNEPPARNEDERELLDDEITRLLLRVERLKEARGAALAAGKSQD